MTELRLDWCKLMAYKEGTFGGQIAENWIAYLRICKWIYGSIYVIMDDKEYIPPDKWNKSDNVEWLQARDLPFTGNTK